MNIILKGNICYSKTISDFVEYENSYLVCENTEVVGIFSEIPERYKSFPVKDYTDCIIIPGLVDLHVHAPQFAFRGLGMDVELLEWLNTYTFPEEIKYEDIEYANNAYQLLADAIAKSETTRACVFATIHKPATIDLMQKLENTGIISYVGLVEMDRNAPEKLCQISADEAYEITDSWINESKNRFKNTKPILTPRFIPTCTYELMLNLGELQVKYKLPVQSHLAENLSELEWVQELYPECASYAQAYNQFGLFGSEDGVSVPTIMAHCVWCDESMVNLIKDNNVYVAHCPQSNINLSSGIAPIRHFIDKEINIGLGTDVAAGASLSIFRAISDAVQASKLYWRLIDDNGKPLSIYEAFYLATAGGGSFFGKVGKFENEYEFDAIVIDDKDAKSAYPLTISERLTRVIYNTADYKIVDKYVRGENVWNV